ncbi:hypothetical protein LTR84_005517 [Exophiala bonariae]|uniref:RNA-dependent RNA polymerase n=1 Tax=Exophiala bonariae TaxID=1690606 RepID=A0AAV9N695_9EURO|nr:hypothetical protein LTR84_005517 [Exophiala bonariae]
MEVFVRGVPERATENQLQKSFRTVLTPLGILDWNCQKRTGNNYCFVLFLNIQDAQKFLELHGQVKSAGLGRDFLPPGRTNVMFNGIALSCARSRRTPDQWALKNLQMEAKAREKKPAKPTQEKPTPAIAQGSDSELPIHSISCGLWKYTVKTSEPLFMTYRKWKITGTIKFTSKKIIIKTDRSQRIDIMSPNVWETIVSGLPNPGITVTCTDTPMFFRTGPDLQKTTAASTDLSQLLQSMNLSNRPSSVNRFRIPSLDTEHASIVGSCLVYHVGLPQISTKSQTQALERMHLRPPLIRPNILTQVAPKSFKTEFAPLLNALKDPVLPFPIKFQLQRLSTVGSLPPDTVLALLPIIKSLLSRCNLRTTVEIIRSLFRQLPYRSLEADPAVFAVESLKSRLREHYERVKTGEIDHSQRLDSDNIAYIHKVSITPSRLYLSSGPEPENNNRVLRKYPDHHDYFIRVQFCEEDGQQLRYSAQVSNDEIFRGRFTKLLNEGFNLAGRHFSFLGFSHSSLRAQSCWFMAPFVHEGRLLLDRMLIQGLGDFSRIRCPAKCAARIGQAFSETPTAITIPPGVAREIPDVERNGRVFSDGVGTVSRGVLEKIWAHLPTTRNGRPLLFQIRYGGAKGMIALDSRLAGDALRFRRSMMKFPGSDSLDFEICNNAFRALPYYLNQQSIKILEDMGVDDEFFFFHQNREVRRLRSTTSSASSASKFLKRHSIGNRISLPWLIRKLEVLGLSFRDDPFLKNIVEIAVLLELRSLKYKSRIPVEDGYTLHGIMDETGFLKEGEIFCTVEEAGKDRVVVQRNVVVTRSPALHPGDIQLANAVHPPYGSPLLDLRNCVCFSQHGERDLPSMLSGGDLDGDLYQVLFDSRAKPKRKFTPADYSRPPPIDLQREVTREDMTDFFITFMATDQLGRIANNHKIIADQRADGTMNPDCLTLAEMHSTAVDFSKSGIPVDLSKMPRFSSCRPDFMAFGPHITVTKGKPLAFSVSEDAEPDDEDDKPIPRYYESDKILGKLYRAIDEHEIFTDVQQSNTPPKVTKSVLGGILEYIKQNCELSFVESYMNRARGIRAEYEECVRNVSWEYSPDWTKALSEQEVFIGNILGKTGAQTKRQHDLAVSMSERFDADLAYIVSLIAHNDDEEEDEDHLGGLALSVGCFLASIEDLPFDLANTQKTDGLVSFRYVAAALCLKEIEYVQKQTFLELGKRAYA